MGLRVILFGASGMIGKGVLLEALDDPGTSHVLVVGRSPIGLSHPKLSEILHKDFADFGPIREKLRGYDACFFCLGVTALGLSEEEYSRITYGYTIAAAETLVKVNPKMVFTYVSGQGTDSTEKGRAMWARVKGRTENKLLAMPFRAAYVFRPGFVRPKRGLKSRVRWYRVMYTIMSPVAGLMERSMPNQATNTVKIGRAMLYVAKHTPPSGIVDPKDINAFATIKA